MIPLKDTRRANVRFGFDGHVYKIFAGPQRERRFENETRVLRYLERRGCDFVPRLVADDPDALQIVTTHCGDDAPLVSEERVKALFDELERFGVRHGDAFARNVTYNRRTQRFNVIDFEYATILETGEGYTIEDEQTQRRVVGEN